MHERLIIDGNSVYEVDEECLKRRNVPPPLHPHPLLFPQKDPFPQQERRRMIQIIELHPHPLSVEHPQFVAVKSLISDLQINIFTV